MCVSVMIHLIQYGDLAIWAGELIFLHMIGIDLIYINFEGKPDISKTIQLKK